LYFAQSGIVNLAVPLTALIVTTTYFALQENTKLYIISGACLVLTKAPGLLLILSILIFVLFRDYRKSKKILFKKIIIYSIPFIFFAVWLVYHKWQAGWWFYPRIFTYQIDEIALALYQRTKALFLENYRFLLTAGMLGYVLLKKIHSKSKKTPDLFLLIWLFIFICLLVFSSYVRFLPRYLLITYPFYYIIGAYCLVEILKRKKIILVGTVVVLIALSTSNWHGQRVIESSGSGGLLESNLEYLDLVKTHRLAARFIEEYYPQSTVLTSWPQCVALEHPEAGYFNTQIDYIYFLDKEVVSDSEFDLVYYSQQSHRAFEMRELMNKLNLQLLKSFRSNGKSTAIYKIIRE
ncbi:hypothetical protein ACFL2I_08040, partial [Candidatus Omnitrophota bacterium]